MTDRDNRIRSTSESANLPQPENIYCARLCSSANHTNIIPAGPNKAFQMDNLSHRRHPVLKNLRVIWIIDAFYPLKSRMLRRYAWSLV